MPEIFLEAFITRPFEEPTLAYVGNVPWFDSSDMLSNVGQMGMALGLAAGITLLVETAKSSMTSRHAYPIYLFCLLLQAAVTWAAFTNGAADWAAHCKSLVFTRGSKEILASLASPHPRFQWYSIATLLALGVAAFVQARKKHELLPGSTEAGSRILGSRKNWYWLGTAWLAGALARQATDLWFPPSGNWPHLANLAAWPGDPSGLPQSTTVRFFGPLFFALLGVLLVEVVKVLQIRRGRRAAYLPLLAFQVLLFCDVVASAAPDWAAYALSSVFGRPVPMEALPSWPWISVLALGLLLLLDLRSRRAERITHLA